MPPNSLSTGELKCQYGKEPDHLTNVGSEPSNSYLYEGSSPEVIPWNTYINICKKCPQTRFRSSKGRMSSVPSEGSRHCVGSLCWYFLDCSKRHFKLWCFLNSRGSNRREGRVRRRFTFREIFHINLLLIASFFFRNQMIPLIIRKCWGQHKGG